MARIDNEPYQMLGDETMLFFKNHNLNEDEAREITRAFLHHLTQNLSGITIYIPKALKHSSRYAQIQKEFNGYNHSALAKRFDISISTVYKALKAKPATV